MRKQSELVKESMKAGTIGYVATVVFVAMSLFTVDMTFPVMAAFCFVLAMARTLDFYLKNRIFMD